MGSAKNEKRRHWCSVSDMPSQGVSRFKQSLLVLAIVFVVILLPFHFLFAISQTQIAAAVQLVCPDKYGNTFSGTGTVIDPKGIILTNKHIVIDIQGGVIQTCFVGFVSSKEQELNFGTEINPNVADVKYVTNATDMDAAILYLRNTENRIYPYVNIWNSDSAPLKLGEKIEIIGFPAIGGNTITYTSGVLSGFGSKSAGQGNYIKTSAPMEHGNSGGAAYINNRDFIGIPTMVVAGPLNSISFILLINSIYNWLSGKLGQDYSTIIPQKTAFIGQGSKPLQQKDWTPPDISQVKLKFYDCSNIYSGRNALGNLIATHWPVLKSDCQEIVYDKDMLIYQNIETVWTDISLPDEVSADIEQWNFVWGLQPHKKPVESRQILREQGLPGGFSKPYPEMREYGDFFYSLQLMDLSGNVSDAKNWVYRYRQSNKTAQYDQALVSRLKGRILLQVQSRGEAWYVNVDDGKRYYMKDGSAAYSILRKFSLGITDKDLLKIPSQAEAHRGNMEIVNRLKGKILLQVEQNGEAWYLNPADGKRYFMGTPEGAFHLMRNLGLGISEEDIEKIPIGDIKN